MSENYVTREEFENLKEEVKEMKQCYTQNSHILQDIDKKVDVINQKILTAEKMDNLRLEPLEQRVNKIEEGTIWLRRTFLGQIAAIIVSAVLFVTKQI